MVYITDSRKIKIQCK